MAGHSLLNQVRTKNEIVVVDDAQYNVILSYNKVVGIDGYVVGVKFTDGTGSMDSAVAKSANGIRLSLAISHKTIQMLKPDLHQVAILGFYLLTDDIDASRPGGSDVKIWAYTRQARTIHKACKDRLQYLTRFDVQGGTAWAMTEKPYSTYEHVSVLENEIAKQLRISL